MIHPLLFIGINTPISMVKPCSGCATYRAIGMPVVTAAPTVANTPEICFAGS
jgi:hypothetical protein